MMWGLTVVCDQYPDEPRPVSRRRSPSRNFLMNEPGGSYASLTLKEAMEAIDYFQDKAVNKLGYNFILAPLEKLE